MTERQFIFWLRGYICHNEVKILSEKEVTLIKEYLNKVRESQND